MRIVKNAMIYMAGSLANEAAAVIVLPILTRYLTPEEYGSAALFMTAYAFITPLVGMSMQTHINRNFFKVDREAMANVSYNAILGMLFAFLALLALLACLTPSLGHFIEAVVGISSGWVGVALIVALAASITSQFVSFLRIQARAVEFALFSFCPSLVIMALSILFVAVVHWGWQGRVAGFALGTIGTSVFAFVALRRMGFAKGRLDWQLLKGLFRISLPLVPHQISGKITAVSSRLFLNGLGSREAVGLYSVGFTFGSFLNMPIQAFLNAWSPWVFKSLAARDQKHDLQIVRLNYIVVVGLVAMWALIALVLPGLLRLLTSASYHGAGEFISWVALSFVFQGMYGLLVPILIDEARTDAIAVFTGTVAALSLPLNWGLILHYGAIGAAYTAVICEAVRFGLVFWYANRVRPMPWRLALCRENAKA